MKRLVAFFEIPCENFSRAIKFYQTVFDIEMSSFECETEKMAFFPSDEEDGKSPGAISWAPDFKPSGKGVLVSLNCVDMEATTSLIEQVGGRIVIPKTKIEADDRGYFSVFEDCEGNQIGLYSDK
ncbi:VOC family protein [Dysgonomonas sp. 520]|uniref:VOC family protein n=1 Tax=Dysgonomonas sp. 520 TaxID=2302931 RepID=UPI0013D47313|nr:VOC family protein [Dysgonomonas sp. 520]NDW09756.1 VOC family protein [Dysgonomonas sp. 520]